jgi:hypothetical protein
VPGRDLEMKGMAEEPCEVRGEKADEASTGSLVAVLSTHEERIERGAVFDPEPSTSPSEDLAMAIEKLYAGESKRQPPRSSELVDGNNRHRAVSGYRCRL